MTQKILAAIIRRPVPRIRLVNSQYKTASPRDVLTEAQIRSHAGGNTKQHTALYVTVVSFIERTDTHAV